MLMCTGDAPAVTSIGRDRADGGIAIRPRHHVVESLLSRGERKVE